MAVNGGVLTLGEGCKDTGKLIWRHSNSRIRDLYENFVFSGKGLDGDLPAVGRELARIFQEVPKNLLEPHGVGKDSVARSLQAEVQVDLFLAQFLAHLRDGVLQSGAKV